MLRDDYKTGDKTFTAQITKLKASSPMPDVLYVSAMPDEIGLIVKQMRQAGVTQPIVGGDGYDTPLLVAGRRRGVERRLLHHARLHGGGFHAGDPEVLQGLPGRLRHASGKRLRRARLRHARPDRRRDQAAGSEDRTKIRDAIAATQGYAGVTGRISYRPGIRVPDKTVTIISVTGGKLALGASHTAYLAEP